MLEDLEYTMVEGEKRDHSISLYTLSTCGFCKRAMAFLTKEGFAYRYIHVDLIPHDLKTSIKKTLKDSFKQDVAFPFAVIDDREHLVGFIEPDWRRSLGVEE